MAAATRKERNIVLDWSDVKHKFLKVVGDGKPWDEKDEGLTNKHHRVAYRFSQYHHAPYEEDSFVGGTPAQTLGWVRDGYYAPEFAHSAAYVPMAQKKRPTWSEEPEGDIDLARLYGGYDDPYMVPADQERKPGIRVMIEYAFACGVSSKTIEQYGAWVAGLLGSLESSGYDLTVDLWIPLDQLFQGIPGRSNILIRVKRENEVSDFTEWSAIFAPTGYRHLGFISKLVAGDKIKKHTSDSLGRTIGGKSWGLDYDKENSILKINVDQRGHHMYGGDAFPKDRLNEQAKKLGLI